MKEKESFYLGLSFNFNASACIISDKRGLVCSLSQERLNGEKNTKQIPFDAALKCLELAGVNNIDGIAVSNFECIRVSMLKKYSPYEIRIDDGITWQTIILEFFKHRGFNISNDLIVKIDHHTAHRKSTFGFYGFPFLEQDYYLISSDGFGDNKSGVIEHNRLGIISEVSIKNSLGLVYQFTTGALGFKEHQHEGKITGLAAYGSPKYVKDFELMYSKQSRENGLDFTLSTVDYNEEEREKLSTSNIKDFEHYFILRKIVYTLINRLLNEQATSADIAASVQEFVEKHTINWIKNNFHSYGEGDPDLYLAGGLFANVKLNQKIKELNLFNNIYVCPAMGDEGTCIGAAIELALLRGRYSDNITSYGISSKVMSGTNLDTDLANYRRLETMVNSCNLKVNIIKFENDQDTATYLAEKLAENMIVCLMRGKMEFGPRALCHRSILYNCSDKETNNWLNKKLNRTEFMPFAPVCRRERANDLFKELRSGEISAKFMTMTFQCTDEFIRNYPAACHIDNTARPQIVDKDDDEFTYSLLEKYEELTGLKALINTSFNLHNNPIIESIDIGFSSWLTSGTDILAIGNVILERY